MRRSTKWNDDSGNFTIEASLVLPIVLLVTALFIFLCLYIYQQSMLAQASAAASERTAYIWDNSYKTASTGEVQSGLHDSLYWRMTDDHVLGSLFGLTGGDRARNIPLPGGSSDGLPESKMLKGSTAVPVQMQGEMSYQNLFLIKKLTTTLHEQVSLTPLHRVMAGGGTLTVSGQSVVVDPVEFIRSVDLMRYYGAKFKGDSNGTDKTKAGEVLHKYGGSR
ncbi:TadE family protein [Paenibacillus sp. JCM 10914]|uniref:TadE family protein n=1 Tax=Paenibacillus sp. JCM 10914 TaxID=1236974 RepID=UPI0003CC70D1|nr:TadE family protein [Paenibacillus sp. JCM 10914]GAE09720.1 hypothetical protein JCM10914_6096 [Paenibacillus sp. JCM 10914]